MAQGSPSPRGKQQGRGRGRAGGRLEQHDKGRVGDTPGWVLQLQGG